jgi:hypothetical protein
VRPQLFDPNQASLSPGLAAILAALRSYPRITRKQLAEKVLAKLLGEKSRDASSSEYGQAKTNLASDLLWLAKAGHVIEFSDGTLDLPLSPKTPDQKEPAEGVSATPSVSTDMAISEEGSDLVKAEHETLTEQAPAAEGEVDEGTIAAQTGIKTEPGHEQLDQKSSESASNLGENISQDSTEGLLPQPTTIPSPAATLTTEAERVETGPPTDSPEERREWAATGP